MKRKTSTARYAMAMLLFCVLSNAFAQVDGDATTLTRNLYGNLKKMANSDQFMFGQEFFNSYRQASGLFDTESASDCKDVTGTHPAVLGSDFHYFLDKSADEKRMHTEAIKYAYQQGYVVTMDWHISGRYAATPNYDANNNNKYIVYNTVYDKYGDRQWLYSQLDRIIAIINNDLVVNGSRIPIVFRPFHEMNGSWFWWGTSATNSGDYKTFFQLVVDYVKARTTSVLFCWSPDHIADFNYYPGNSYVDVLGLDLYEIGDSWNTTSLFRTEIGKIVTHCQSNGKVAVLSETGYRNGDPNWGAGNYWTDRVLPAILNDPAGKAKKVAWVLTWINANWGANPYVPHSGSSAASKQKFVDFKNSWNVVFGNERPYGMYSTPTAKSSTADEVVITEDVTDVKAFPNPSGGNLTVELSGFEGDAEIIMINAAGQTCFQKTTTERQIVVNESSLLPKGFYILQAKNRVKAAQMKIVIR